MVKQYFVGMIFLMVLYISERGGGKGEGGRIEEEKVRGGGKGKDVMHRLHHLKVGLILLFYNIL